MKIFVAGATGTLGRPVIRILRAQGHDVVGLTRFANRRAGLEALGVHAATGNALDGNQLRSLVVAARPEVVVHLLTALPPGGASRPRHLRATNQLRTVATANLLRAAVAAGARRLVAESFVGICGSSSGDHLLSEDNALPPIGSRVLEETVVALRSLEDQLRTARDAGHIETVALRIGFLYGADVPSTQLLVAQARAGRLFAPRALPGVAPFVHVADAAAAIVAAVERSAPSAVYNIVDDEPMSLSAFLTSMTRTIGARPPRTVPEWLVRLAAPVMAELGSARLRLSNVKAKQEIGWSLRYPTVRVGMADLARTLPEAA